jgi:hypothetical protein
MQRAKHTFSGPLQIPLLTTDKYLLSGAYIVHAKGYIDFVIAFLEVAMKI